MRILPLLAVLCACNCSGDAPRRPTTPSSAPVGGDAAAGSGSGAGSGSASVTAAIPGNAVPFSESAAQSYWTTPDEIEASTKFALEEYAAAAKAWTKARAAAKKDAERQARIDLMLGLCAERSNDATT